MLTLEDEGGSRNQGSRIRSFGENDGSKETLSEHQGITLLTKRLEWCREENIPARHFKFVFPAKRLMRMQEASQWCVSKNSFGEQCGAEEGSLFLNVFG